jgi:hypothetical protein
MRPVAVGVFAIVGVAIIKSMQKTSDFFQQFRPLEPFPAISVHPVGRETPF